MKPTTRAALAAVLLTVACAAHSGPDPLLVPPAPFEHLSPVPELDLSGAEMPAREAFHDARAELARRLADPDTPAQALAEAYGRLGALYHVHRIEGGAVPAYRNARELAPQHFRWAYLDAWLAQGSGRLEHALDAYRTARGLDPAYAALDLREGEVLFELNRPDEGAARLEAALLRPELRAAAAFRLGQIALQRRSFAQAEQWFRQALAADPDAAAIHAPLAQALRAQGEIAAARDALERRGDTLPHVDDRIVRELEDLDTGARRHFLEGLLAVRENRFEAGAAAFARGLAEDPENVAARISHARALALSGDVSTARDELEEALARRPQEPLALFLLGVLQEADADWEQARQLYERVLELQPGHPGASHQLGLLAFREADWPAAAHLLEGAGATHPDNVLAQVLALVATVRTGGADHIVVTRLEAIADAHPRAPLPRYALSRLLSASEDPSVRDPARGLAIAEELLLSGPIPPVYEALALANAAAGNKQAARAALQQAGTMYRNRGAFAARIDAQKQRLADDLLPATAWPADDPVLIPPPPDPRGVLREYPTPRPF